MEVVNNNFLPGDQRLIDRIVYELKSQGIFDNFRKECIADVDTKPAYQNLRQRVEGTVAGFLKTQKWRPDLNKNQVRENLRKQIYESGFLETGVERIVDQVVNPKINSIFLPQVENVVYKFLGIQKPSLFDELKNSVDEKPVPKQESDSDLLPIDLETVSPDSESQEKKVDVNNESQKLDDSKMDDEESPPFEPLDEPTKIARQEENSVDSNLSGFSGLVSHDSNQSIEVANEIVPMEISYQDSQTSKQSLEDQMSIDDNELKIDMSEDSNNSKTSLFKSDTNSKSLDFNQDTCSSTDKSVQSTNKAEKTDSSKKSEEKSKSNEKNSDKHRSSHKHKSRHDSKSESKDRKNDKDRKSERDKKDHKDKDRSRHRTKDDKEKRDKSKSGKDEKDSDKQREHDRSKRSSSKHSSKNKDDSKKHSEENKVKESSDKKESKDSKDAKSKSSKPHSSSKSSKADSKSSSKHSEKNRSDSVDINKSSSKSKKDIKSHKKDDRHHKHSSSSKKSEKKDKDKKDSKKESKDDHYSLKDKKSNRRSTDRDSSDGQSGARSSSSSLGDTSVSQVVNSNQDFSIVNSESTSGDSGNSEQLDKESISHNLSSENEDIKVNENLKETDIVFSGVKLIKPKFASNIFEARRLMKIRKKIGKLEKRRQMDLIRKNAILNKQKYGDDIIFVDNVCNEEIAPSMVELVCNEDGSYNSNSSEEFIQLPSVSDNTNDKNKTLIYNNVNIKNRVTIETVKGGLEIDEENHSEVVEVITEIPLQNSVISKESWDAVEAKLISENVLNVDYNSYTEEKCKRNIEESEKKTNEETNNVDDESFLGYAVESIAIAEEYFNKVQSLVKGVEDDIAELYKNYLINLATKKVEPEVPRDGINKRLPKVSIVDLSIDNEIIITPTRGSLLDNNNKNNSQLQIDCTNDKMNNVTKKTIEAKSVPPKAKKQKLMDGSVNENNFNLPLSPADSDKSFTTASDKSEKKNQRVKVYNTRNQRYSSDDLYKPRLQFATRRRTKKT